MSTKLTYETSFQIITRALERTGESSPVEPHTRIGDILVEASTRELLRDMIRDEVKLAGFGIKRRAIPVDPHFTIDRITTAISNLAGDPGTDDD
jgi:hypothetical protein